MTLANPLTVLLAQPFTMPVVKLTVADATSTRTPAFSARVCRMFLANVSGGAPAGRNAGAADDPDEWLVGHLKYALNNNGALANWNVALTSEGKCRITNLTGAGGTITWDDSSG